MANTLFGIIPQTPHWTQGWGAGEIMNDRDEFLDAVRAAVNAAGGVRITTQQFLASSGLKLSDLFRHFPKWSDALTAAGFAFDAYNAKIDPEELLADWGLLARKLGAMPTRNHYKLEGNYSPGVFERNFGPWSKIPSFFREFANESSEWQDVVNLLPAERMPAPTRETETESPVLTNTRHSKLAGRPTYGDPIDFRGLRHAPVNEDGVIFLFGMVARELGYLVESVQGGFPDCEAKRQIAPGQWQRVRIEFEFESRNFRDHGHDPDGCDVIICWKHNWPECPTHLDVVELHVVIRQLGDAVD